MILNKFYVDDLIKTALKEDINYCDVTTDYLIPSDQEGEGRLMAKADGIVCGTEAAARVFTLLDADTKIEFLKHDGKVNIIQKTEVFTAARSLCKPWNIKRFFFFLHTS